MIKILFFIPTLMHGGAERVLINLVNNLDQNKYEITVQTLFDTGVHKDKLRKEIRYKSVFSKLFRGSTKIFQLFKPEFLYKKIIGEKYDIAVSYLEGSTARILSGCPYQETKLVSWIHVELNTEKMVSIGFRSLEECQKQYEKFDKVVCVSETVKKVFLESIKKIDRSKVTVLYNVNETEMIKDCGREEIENNLFNNNEVNICSVAKIIEPKGYDRLVRVHKKLKAENYNHHIYILGIGEQKKELEKFLKKYNLQDSFTFLGFKDNPYKYISKCDMYICSSRREGFSTAVTEALILGLPTVSTNCSGAEELLGKNNEYGIVVENSEIGIYKGLKKMLDNSILMEYYRKMAFERGKKFSKKETLQRTEEMFNDLWRISEQG